LSARSTAARRSTRWTRPRWRPPSLIIHVYLEKPIARTIDDAEAIVAAAQAAAGAVCAVGYREVNEVARRIDAEITVVSLEPTSIEGILNTIATVGAMTDAEEEAVEVVGGLRERLGLVEARVATRRAAGRSAARVVGLEWLDPPFAVGHWVPEQIRRAGAWDLLGAEGDRSIETTWSAVREVDPELLVLMPCGFHVEDGLAAWARAPRPDGWADLAAVREGHVFLVDGSAYFSRPGPRVIDGVELLAELFDPEGSAGSAPFGSWVRVD